MGTEAYAQADRQTMSDNLDLFAALLVLGIALVVYLFMPDLSQGFWIP